MEGNSLFNVIGEQPYLLRNIPFIIYNEEILLLLMIIIIMIMITNNYNDSNSNSNNNINSKNSLLNI